MKKLNASQFDQARNFLLSEARRLEMRLFEFHFDQNSSSQGKVFKELKNYQNPDGGFGRALEPDVRMGASSVVATKFALQILIDVGASMQERLVQDGIAYLLQAYDRSKGVWPLVSNELMDAPHAPWWDAAGLEKEFGSYLANPKAGILRCLLEYSNLAPDELIEDVTRSVMAHLDTLPIQMNFFDAVSYLLLLQADALNEVHRTKLRAKLKKTGKVLVSSDPETWSDFAIKPLWLSPSPNAPLALVLDSEIKKNLDYEIDHQNRDGSWSPTWSWGYSFPGAWQLAQQEWKGILTLATLRSLRDFGRVDGVQARPFSYKYPID
jgi:hypothetical protein